MCRRPQAATMGAGQFHRPRPDTEPNRLNRLKLLYFSNDFNPALASLEHSPLSNAGAAQHS